MKRDEKKGVIVKGKIDGEEEREDKTKKERKINKRRRSRKRGRKVK